MSHYGAKIVWQRASDEGYLDHKYNRGHEWHFDGGAVIAASSSPHVVPLPYSVEANVDPEEAFVASLSSCHMLFFLSIAAKNKFVVDSYVDNAVGVMEKGPNGKIAMTKVTLKPYVQFAGEQPSMAQLAEMHHQAHEQCFIANSVTTEVVTEIQV
ncbi:OsmC family protein [Motilimonas eburnea]|uniref:OsmC family protein n=1 Tax=Motilimonas eburnea TaxID=1737488 RepID=UPI001E28C3F3|nr:OsmC family protein [Motilimonas eburnea]MCE2572980.1 OsmC family protein [Motilimonas eburnea]